MAERHQAPLLPEGDGADRAPERWWAQTGKTDWCTDGATLALVRAVAPGGVIGFDPASNPFAEPRVRARACCMLERGENGLARPWRGHGLLWNNPPYGEGEIEPFTAKAAREFGGGDGRAPLGDDCAILLTPANTETSWYHRDLAGQADATCLRKGRIAFVDPATGKESRGSSVKNLFSYFGDRPDVFLRVFGPSGDARLTAVGARRLLARGGERLLLRLACGGQPEDTTA